MSSNARIAHLALFTVALIYGANYSIAKSVLNAEYLSPKAFIGLRISFGAIVFFLFNRLYNYERIKWVDLPKLALAGLFGTMLNQLMFFEGLKLTTPIHASLIMLTTPILVLFLSAIFIKEQITGKRMTGIIIGALGAGLLISMGQSSAVAENVARGDLFIFINAASYGIYLIIIKSLMIKYNPMTIVSWAFIFGTIYILPLSGHDLLTSDFESFPANVWWSIVYVLVFTTAAAYFLNAYALKKVSATVVSAYIYLQPLIASLISIFLKTESLNAVKISAAVLIFIAVYLVSFSPRSKKSSTKSS